MNLVVIFLTTGQVAVYDYPDTLSVDMVTHDDGSKSLTLNHMPEPTIYSTVDEWKASLEQPKLLCGCTIARCRTVDCVECGNTLCHEHGDWLDIDGEVVCCDCSERGETE